MAKKRKYSRSKNRTSGAVVVRRYKRKGAVATKGKRKKSYSRAVGLNLVKGPYAMYVNPAIEGGIGGAGAVVALDLIPKDWLAKPNIAKNAKWWKRAAIAAVALAAAHYKQPLIAAGAAGYGLGTFIDEEGFLNDDSPSSQRRFRPARYANPNILSEARLMSEGRLLSYGRGTRMPANPYPNYIPLSDIEDIDGMMH